MPCSSCDSARNFPSKTKQINSTKKSNHLKKSLNPSKFGGRIFSSKAKNISRTYGLPNNFKSKFLPLGGYKK